MLYLHVKNLGKYHPSYKDRKLSWCKLYFTTLNSDLAFLFLDEVDRWRFLAFIMLELMMQRPVPIDERFLTMKGFNFKRRRISITLNALEKFVEISDVTVPEEPVTKPLQECDVDKIREYKEDKIKSFVTPTLEEIKTYCNERKSPIDPEAFFNFYEANGWVQGKNKPIKNWKACVATWEKNQNDFKPKGAKNERDPRFFRKADRYESFYGPSGEILQKPVE